MAALGICLVTLTAVLLIPWPPALPFILACGSTAGIASLLRAALHPATHPVSRAMILGTAALIVAGVLPTLVFTMVLLR